MNFQIRALPREQFSHLFGAPDEQLLEAGVARVHVEQSPGYPCRVSLRDAKVGETVLLLNYEHLGEASPYRASHAIFVVEGAEDVTPAVNEIPDVLRTRLISVRGFNQDHHMIAADVCEGSDLAAKIQDMATVEGVDYLHLHNAKPGCFAAKVDLLPALSDAV
ncbi:MAG: DUF1203 domain-containing protein [Pseudomonadota bacterium]